MSSLVIANLPTQHQIKVHFLKHELKKFIVLIVAELIRTYESISHFSQYYQLFVKKSEKGDKMRRLLQ